MTDETPPVERHSEAPHARIETMVADPGEDDARIEQLIVAVHGVGDQYENATLQSVVNQFCRHYGEPAGVPLGAFHGVCPFLLARKNSRLEKVAFAEVYWAAIPRAIVNDQHTLEEAKTWASTLIERMHLRWSEAKQPWVCRKEDFAQCNQILHEMIETVAVIDRLSFLADRAGIFTFDLRRVLDSYLGDVQIVAEFSDERAKIVQAFLDTVGKSASKCKKAKIYLIAHSEGTVVALLGLLKAFSTSPAPEWTTRVHGLMTLGSPIDKHLYFWPALFSVGAPQNTPPQPIAWRNYYDKGDPIGFELDGVREWLDTLPSEADRSWGQVFEFGREHDFGFTRYPFPGKAHIDYWNDEGVFGHFIGTVMNEPNAASPATVPTPVAAPRSIASSWIASWVLPYVGVFALLVIGAFLLYKATTMAIDPDGWDHDSWTVARGVFGLGLLLFGVTVASRLPRLTRSWLWRGAGLAVGVGCAVGFRLAVGDLTETLSFGRDFYGGGFVALAMLVTIGAMTIGAWRPSWGAKPMIGLGAAATIAALYLLKPAFTGPAWRLVIAVVAFLYVWWLAALIFDLVVVWHVYIRTSLVNEQLRAMTRPQETEIRKKWSGALRWAGH